jgi:pyrroline-5-carboxylate reductase
VLLATPGGTDSLREVCSALRWRPDHRVISIVAGGSYELLRAVTQPAGAVTIALPLPPAEWHASTTKVYPRDDETETLMARVGVVIAFDSFDKMVALSVGALMGHFYKQLAIVEAWLVEQGIDADQAAAATSSYFATFHAASSPEFARPGLFAELVAEQTPNGLNEQVVREVEAAGGYDAIRSALDGVRARQLAR